MISPADFGGGGLIAGMAVAARALKPDIRIIGVQASGANAMYLAFHDRYTGPLEAPATIADGLLTRAPGRRTLPLVRELVEEVVADVIEVRAEGDGDLAQLFDLILVGDFVSLWLAAQEGIDPGPVPALSGLKAALASS